MTWIVALVIALVLVLVLLILGMRFIREYERAVIFRFGRLRKPRGPGPIYLIPGMDQMVRADLRVITLTIPPQEVITRDNVTARVNAVVLFRVVDPVLSVMAVENPAEATSQGAQHTLC